MSIWSLIPSALAARAKGIVAVIGAVAYVVTSYVPSLAQNHVAAIAIAVLTSFGVYTVRNVPRKTPAP